MQVVDWHETPWQEAAKLAKGASLERRSELVDAVDAGDLKRMAGLLRGAVDVNEADSVSHTCAPVRPVRSGGHDRTWGSSNGVCPM